MNVLIAVPVLLLAAAPGGPFTGPAEVFERGRVSTAASEVRLAIRPDGRHLVWGVIDPEGGLDLWECRKGAAGWSEPTRVPFDTPATEFDPSFAPDGRSLYFFSNRPGGQGGDDLYVVPLDAASGRWGEPRNLGPGLNTAGDEWAPVVSPDGARLLFASDGRGGQGLHDLFVASRAGESFAAPEPLDAGVNGPDEDFDAAYLDDGRSVVFTRRAKDQDGADLWLARWRAGRLEPPVRLGPEVNADGAWNLGPSLDPRKKGLLYFSSRRSGGAGRNDIYRVPFRP